MPWKDPVERRIRIQVGPGGQGGCAGVWQMWAADGATAQPAGSEDYQPTLTPNLYKEGEDLFEERKVNFLWRIKAEA